MNLNLKVEPYIGVGDLKFGMTKEQVAEILGAADRISKNYLGEPVEYRRHIDITVTYSPADHLLIELGFGPSVKAIKYKDVGIFEDNSISVLKCLMLEDGNPLEYMGFVVLLHLGIALTAFHQGDEDDKTLTAFMKGRWDFLEDDLKPFKINA